MDDKKIKWIVIAGVMGVSVLTAFWDLTGRAIGNHEAYVGVAARNMVSSGDWVVPMFNGKARLNKTPLCYWLTAAAAKITGGVNDFTVRLPGAALAVLSAIAIFYFISDQLGFRTGALSAIIWSTSFCYIRYSHTGRPEMALTAFVAVAMLSFYSAVQASSHRKQIYCMLVFWISFSLAMLAKGPAPLPLIIPAIFFYFVVYRKWKLVPKLLPIAGVILFLLIVLPWPIAILKGEPTALTVWKNEFLGRATGEYASGGQPCYYYFTVIFVHFLPFSAFIPFAFAAPFYRIWEEKRDAISYQWLWFFAGIAAMTVCGGKRPHYILPIMPAMAVLTGIILDDMIFARKVYNRRLARNFLAAYIVVFLMGLCVFFFVRPGIEDKEADENLVIRDLAQKSAAAAIDKPIIAYCKVNESFIYYFNKNVPVLCNIDEVYAEYVKGDGVIASGEKFEQLKKDGRFRLLITGLDSGRGLFVKNAMSE